MSLSARSTAQELMDTGCVDYEDYRRCLRDLSRVNVVTLTHRPMLRWLSRQVAEDAEFSVLDVACGYGDALRQIRKRFPRARLTGIDLNPWAIKAAREATDHAAAIAFVNGDAFAYRPDRMFDFIISSQFTHHLTDQEVVAFLGWQSSNSARGWFIGDLHRHALAYYGFPILARIAFWHRFVRGDGQISVARSFRRSEWEGYLKQAGIDPARASIVWYLPFRLCVESR